MPSHSLKCSKNTGIKNTKISKRNKEKKCLHQNLECVIVRNEASRDLGNLIKTAFLPLTLSFLIN